MKPTTMNVILRVNGRDRDMQVDTRATLLDTLRDTLGLTGTKKGCDHGQCGACTVLCNGERMNSCLSLTVMHEGDEITTIEGLGTIDALHPLQAAFVEQDALQCGYCTPGQICSGVAMLKELERGVPSFVTAGDPTLTDDELRERMSGNLCRCAAYPNILAALRAVAKVRPFTYERASSVAEAAAMLRARPGARLLAGGTNLLDLMKNQIEAPAHLVDVNRLGLDRVERTVDGGVSIGALVRNTALSADPIIRREYAVLSRAIVAGASGQLRNRATTAGNLLQRTRCGYFYDAAQPCNKRRPGSGCAALVGLHRNHAILGGSDACIATNPSDLNVALRALDAVVHTLRADGSQRSLPIAEVHRLPGTTPHLDHVLESDEVVTHFVLPGPVAGVHTYRKVRDRASYAFALVSLASIVERRDGQLVTARLAVGGIAPKPWRVEAAEAALLEGASADDAATMILAGAEPTEQTRFKLDLVRALVREALRAS